MLCVPAALLRCPISTIAHPVADVYKRQFSYFSLTPFGYANFAPLITATLTVAIFLLSLFSLKKKGVLKALFVLSIITVVISLLPLMYGLNYYTLVGAFITVTLVIAVSYTHLNWLLMKMAMCLPAM